MDLVNVLLIITAFLMTLILCGLVVFLIIYSKKNKEVVYNRGSEIQAIKQEIVPEIARQDPPKMEFVKNDMPSLMNVAKELKVEEKPKMDLEKELKNFPRKDRKKLRMLYEQYQKGKVVDIKEKKDGKVSGQV